MLYVDGINHKMIIKREGKVIEELSNDEIRNLNDNDLEALLLAIHEDGYRIVLEDKEEWVL